MRELLLTTSVVVFGAAGALGALGPEGAWLGPLGSLAIGWTVWRHRWPTKVPLRLRAFEPPEGPDERTVVVVFRHEAMLLGWDAGILWFERGGVGFVGRTVSFVLPRALMHPTPEPPTLRTLLRVPQMNTEVFGTTMGIVPLARELYARMTLARIDALPDEITSETILPPTSIHPDLLRRGIAVRRRLPFLAILSAGNLLLMLAPAGNDALRQPLGVAIGLCVFLGSLLFGTPLPPSIRSRLPREPRRGRRGT